MAAVAVRNNRKKNQKQVQQLRQQQPNFISKAVIATPILEVKSEVNLNQSQISIPSVLRVEEVTEHKLQLKIIKKGV